jgi:hypothetical protein
MKDWTMEQRVAFLEETAIANLRDFFATSALSILASNDMLYKESKYVAEYVYEIADAMLAQREKKGN